MIELIVSARGVPEEKAFAFEQNIIKIGRVKENDISLPGANISRLHCLITFENGEFYISDQSSNGTLLNGEVIGKNRKMPMRHGDQIQAGDFILQFKVKTPEEELEKTTDYLQMKFAQLLSEPKSEASHSSLLVMGGPTNGTRLELVNEMEEILLGRTPDCPLQIPSPTVSKHHARIVRRGTVIEIEDLKSANGTLLNGQPLAGVATLRDRDEIILGQKGVEDPIRVVISIPKAVVAMPAMDSVPPTGPPEAALSPKPPRMEEAPPTVRAPSPEPAAGPTVKGPADEALPAKEPASPAPPPPPAEPSSPPMEAAEPAPPGPPLQEPPAPPPPATVKQATPSAGAPQILPPPEIKTGLGATEYIIIGVAVLAVVAVAVVLFFYLTSGN
jgi:pSer/pThr/pTyr-binding forkhead associated (FHA) protein